MEINNVLTVLQVTGMVVCTQVLNTQSIYFKSMGNLQKT